MAELISFPFLCLLGITNALVHLVGPAGLLLIICSGFGYYRIAQEERNKGS